MSEENTAPLVSICIPVHNGGSLIDRALSSCIKQTYRNIEIIVVDNDSVDDTEAVVRRYAQQDKRIHYFRNQSNIGAFRNCREVLKRATGMYVQFLCHDDWLSPTYIEETEKILAQFPQTAGVITKGVSCALGAGGEPLCNRAVALPTGLYPASFFVRNMYRQSWGSLSFFALVRTKDFFEAMEYAFALFEKPPEPISPEFREFHRQGYGVDILIFLKILSKYSQFYAIESVAYLKLTNHQGAGSQFPLEHNARGVLRNFDYYRTCHSYIFAAQWECYRVEMRRYIGAEAFNTLLVNWIKSRFSCRYWRGLNLEEVKNFFRGDTFWERIMIALYFFLLLALRLLRFLARIVEKYLKPITVDNYLPQSDGVR